LKTGRALRACVGGSTTVRVLYRTATRVVMLSLDVLEFENIVSIVLKMSTSTLARRKRQIYHLVSRYSCVGTIAYEYGLRTLSAKRVV